MKEINKEWIKYPSQLESHFASFFIEIQLNFEEYRNTIHVFKVVLWRRKHTGSEQRLNYLGVRDKGDNLPNYRSLFSSGWCMMRDWSATLSAVCISHGYFINLSLRPSDTQMAIIRECKVGMGDFVLLPFTCHSNKNIKGINRCWNQWRL